jgi:signal transduction histidine kinase
MYHGRVLAWLRHNLGRAPGWAGAALAVLLAGLSADQWAGDPGAAAVSVLLAATVVPRRRYPVAAFAAAMAIGAAQLAFGLGPAAHAVPPVHALEPNVTDMTIAVLLYTLAARRPRRLSLAGLAACLIGSAVAVARWAPAQTAPPGVTLSAAAALAGTALTAWVLGESAGRARELRARRARVVDESAARLRRIERDLHDGAQVRLAALAMTLGEIKENLETADGGSGSADGGRTGMLVAAAHRNAKETLAELRDLARGIHPPVLDRGLGVALSALAQTSAIPVGVRVGMAERPSPAIEAIAYFCASELLANVAKHSGARGAEISASGQDGRLLMTVSDDGDGNARVTPGGGLAGLVERVQMVDGRLGIHSPPGGPTVITVELPGRA